MVGRREDSKKRYERNEESKDGQKIKHAKLRVKRDIKRNEDGNGEEMMEACREEEGKKVKDEDN